MADYIGTRPRSKKRGYLQLSLALAIAAAAAAVYTYYDYIWPQRMLERTVKELADAQDVIGRGCDDGDAACRERLAQSSRTIRDNPFEQALAAVLASPDIAKRLAGAHTDGSISFLVAHNDASAPGDEALSQWLDDYGAAVFLDNLSLIARARELYEAQYLKPTPALFQLELMKSMRWQHLPLGAAWRNYTLAAHYLEWKTLAKGPLRDEQHSGAELGMVKEMKKNPTYFTDAVIARIADMARKKLTIERMEAVRDAVKRFARDVRELPLSDERTRIEIEWLASRDGMQPQLKRYWAGPYLKGDELVDLWSCPLLGVRTPATGAMSIISRGSDCKEGGSGTAEDLEVAVSSYAPKPETAAVEQSPTKKKRTRKKPDILSLP